MGHFNFMRGIVGNGGDTKTINDLSPVSALRLNFDQLPSETTDVINHTKNVFGVPMPQFMPQRVISWLDNANIGSDNSTTIISNHSNNIKTNSIASSSSDASSSLLNCNDHCTIITRKVCV